MTVENLKEKKLKRLFDVYDVDDNGILEYTDFEKVSKNFAVLNDWELNSDLHDSLSEQYSKLWNNLKRAADEDEDEQVTLEEWQNYWNTVLNSEQGKEVVQSFGELFLSMLDVDHNGYIGLKEYERYLKAFNADNFDLENAFNKMDTNNDGKLSLDESMQLGLEFFTSNDENSPGNWLFGPIN